MASVADLQAGIKSLEERLRGFVGLGGSRFTPAREAVTPEAICRMVEVVGDRNPIYTDPDFAAKSVHGTLVAPPGSLISWWQNCFAPVLSSNWVDERGVRHFRLDPMPLRKPTPQEPYDEAIKILRDAGFTSTAGVGGELSLKRYPRVGDRLFYSDQKTESIVGPKHTRLGRGYFPTRLTYVQDQNGDLVAEIRLSSISFAPALPGDVNVASGKPSAVAEPPALQPAEGPVARGTTRSIAEVFVGQVLPSLIVESTPSLIIAGALFNHDAMDVHHDRDWARRRGFDDVFMNTMTTHGLATRFVGDWAGPEAVVEHLAWRLGRQQYPHDALYLTGRVAKVENGKATVEVFFTNSLGAHATCTVRLALPLPRP
jgi:acyl dehydratase